MPDATPTAAWPALMRIKRAAAYLDISASTLRTMVAAGQAPAPIRLGKRCPVWSRVAIDAWIDRQAGAAPNTGKAGAVLDPVAEWDLALSGTGDPALP